MPELARKPRRTEGSSFLKLIHEVSSFDHAAAARFDKL
jgi:hypothetical protein